MFLKKLGIIFITKNKGSHLVVEGPHGLIDFWPSTGKWKDREVGDYERGVRELVGHIKSGGISRL